MTYFCFISLKLGLWKLHKNIKKEICIQKSSSGDTRGSTVTFEFYKGVCDASTLWKSEYASVYCVFLV